MLFFAIFGAVDGAVAGQVSLVCTAKNGFSMPLKIDTAKESVMLNGHRGHQVFMDDLTIRFTQTMNGKTYTNTVDRTSGKMRVEYPNGGWFEVYDCRVAKPLF